MNDAPVETEGKNELSQDEKAYAGLAHALMVSTWWIGPLVIYLVQKQSRFVRFHALQALFWQVIFSVLYLIGMMVIIVTALSSAISASHGKPPQTNQFPLGVFIAFPIFWLLCMGGFAISMTLAIVFCLKAMRGEWAGYPVIGRWARRAAGE